MTDYKVFKKNPITGFTLRMTVKNAEHFDPEVQQAFKDLINATEYPKQTKMEDWEP